MHTSVKSIFLVSLFSTSLFAADLQKAIQDAIAANKECKKTGDFYWKISDGKRKVISGAENRIGLKMVVWSLCILAELKMRKLFGQGSNAALTSEHKEKFYYNGAHAQALADKNNTALAQAMKSSLKLDNLSRK